MKTKGSTTGMRTLAAAAASNPSAAYRSRTEAAPKRTPRKIARLNPMAKRCWSQKWRQARRGGSAAIASRRMMAAASSTEIASPGRP